MSESFLNSNVTRFENIELADGSPGDIPGQGMKRDTDYYVKTPIKRFVAFYAHST